VLRQDFFPKEKKMKSNAFRFMSLAITTLLALLLASLPVSATQPGVNGKIAFAAETDTGSQIYTINLDGSGLLQLTNVNGGRAPRIGLPTGCALPSSSMTTHTPVS
jgi:hypothetical protein